MKLSHHQFFLLGISSLGLIVLPARAQVATASAPPNTGSTMAAPLSSPDEKFTIRLGAFFLSNIKTTLNLSNSSGQVGDTVDFAKTLGGDDALNVFRADGEWRFAEKHKAQLSFFDIRMSATRQLSAQINWGDQVYPVAATLNSQFNTTVYKLNYGYVFHRSPTHEFSALVGLHITRFKTSLEAVSLGTAESVSATAPLPIFGLEWKARLSDELTSFVSYQYFGISLDDKYSGNLSDFQAVVEYKFHPNWVVGGGYNRYVLRASVESERQRKLTLRHNYNGLMLFVSTRF